MEHSSSTWKKNPNNPIFSWVTVLFIVCILEYFCISDYSQFARQGGLSEAASSDCFRLDNCSHLQFKPELCSPLQPNSCALEYILSDGITFSLPCYYDSSTINITICSVKSATNDFITLFQKLSWNFLSSALELPSALCDWQTGIPCLSTVKKAESSHGTSARSKTCSLSAGGKPSKGCPWRSFSSGNFFPC